MTLYQQLAGAYRDTGLSDLELAALEWLNGFYQIEHLLATRSWAIALDPEASEALRFAALVHDAERHFPGGPDGTSPLMGPDDPQYLIAHSTRTAEIVDEWLRDRPEGQDRSFRNQVRALILRHEFGGNPDEDVLQAADSLAFLSTFDWLVVEWVRSGRATAERAQLKLDWMLCRIRLQEAVALALPYYRTSSRMLEDPDIYPADLEMRRRLAGDLELLLGQKKSSGIAPAWGGD